MVAAQIPNEQDFFEMGLMIAGAPDVVADGDNYAWNRRVFNSIYQLCPLACERVYAMVYERSTNKRYESPVYFMITINWMTEYNTEHSMKLRFGYTEKTIRKKVWQYLHKISALKAEKVEFCLVWGCLSYFL